MSFSKQEEPSWSISKTQEAPKLATKMMCHQLMLTHRRTSSSPTSLARRATQAMSTQGLASLWANLTLETQDKIQHWSKEINTPAEILMLYRQIRMVLERASTRQTEVQSILWRHQDKTWFEAASSHLFQDSLTWDLQVENSSLLLALETIRVKNKMSIKIHKVGLKHFMKSCFKNKNKAHRTSWKDWLWTATAKDRRESRSTKVLPRNQLAEILQG